MEEIWKIQCAKDLLNKKVNICSNKVFSNIAINYNRIIFQWLYHTTFFRWHYVHLMFSTQQKWYSISIIL